MWDSPTDFPQLSSRLKHIKVEYHFLRQKYFSFIYKIELQASKSINAHNNQQLIHIQTRMSLSLMDDLTNESGFLQWKLQK